MTSRFLDRTTPPHLFTLVAVTSVSALSMSVFLPSLPAMTRFFGSEYWILQLSVTLYLVGNAILQLAVGPLSDHFGRRPVLLGSFVLFCLATLGCIFSTPRSECFSGSGCCRRRWWRRWSSAAPSCATSTTRARAPRASAGS